MRASPTVDDNKRSARGAHLDARRVSAVTGHARPRFGDRTTRAPESDAHEAPYLRTPSNIHSSAADLTFLPVLRRVLRRNVKSKSHTRIIGLLCPFGCDVRKSARCKVIRTSEPGH